MNSTPRGTALSGLVKSLSAEVMMILAQGCAVAVAMAATGAGVAGRWMVGLAGKVGAGDTGIIGDSGGWRRWRAC